MPDPIVSENSANIIDGSDVGFVTEVLEASARLPVIVDFWAPWCGPCKQLTPVLEQAVRAVAGKVRLVKINIDQHPQMAQQLRVRSVPSVIAFVGGKPAGAFQGARSSDQIRAFVQSLFRTDTGEAEALEAAASAFKAGDIGSAAQAYAALARDDPHHVKAIAGLARCYLANGDTARARQTLAMLAGEAAEKDPDVQQVRTALELADQNTGSDDKSLSGKIEADPQDWQARHDRAEVLAGQGQYAQAVEHLLAIIEHEPDWQEGKARALLLKVFEASGPNSEVTMTGRRRLSSLLFC